MPIIASNGAKLWKERGKAIQRLLRPLLANPSTINVTRVGASKDQFTLGVVPSGYPVKTLVNREEPLVATKLIGILLNYYETWMPVYDTDQYVLDRAYMHFHVVGERRSGAKQILSLHCDPSLEPTELHYAYKRGPHLHIEGARPDICRAHIPLCLGDNKMGGANVSELTTRLGDTVKMIADELLPCWERAIRNGNDASR